MARNEKNNVVSMNNIADALSAQHEKVMQYGFSPKQARAAIGKLSAGHKVDGVYTPLPEAFKLELAAVINAVSVDDNDREVVKAQRDHLVMKNQKPWDESLDVAPAGLDEKGHLRVGYANAVAWFRHLKTHRSEKVNPGDILGKRRGRITTRGQLKKFGFTDADIDAAFPSLPEETRRSRGSSSAGDLKAPVNLGGGMHGAAPTGTHRAPAPQIDPMVLIKALVDGGMDFDVAHDIASDAPDTPLALVKALVDGGMDFEAAHGIASELA